MSMFNLIIYFLAFIILVIPMGKHISKLVMHEKTVLTEYSLQLII